MRIAHYLCFGLFVVCSMLPQVAIAFATKDAELESALDHYALVLQSDRNTAKILLDNLWQRNNSNPAIQSWARLAGYITRDVDTFEPINGCPQSFLQHMLLKAETTENPDALTEIYGTEIQCLYWQRRLNDAVIKADKLQFYIQQAVDPRVRYFFNRLLGDLYFNDLQSSRALQHYIESLKALTETDVKTKNRRKISLYQRIAETHATLKNWKSAKEFTQQVMDDVIKYDLKSFELVDVLILQGFIASNEKRYEDAVQYYKRAIAYEKQYGSEFFILPLENNLGSSLVALAQYDAAKEVFILSMERATRLEKEYDTELMKFKLGYVDVMQGSHSYGLVQMQEAMKYFKERLSMGIQSTHMQAGMKYFWKPEDSTTQLATHYEWLAKAYAAAGMHKEQAEALIVQIQFLQDVQFAESETKLNELNNRYDRKTQEKAAEIAALEQEKVLQQQMLKNETLKRQTTILLVGIVGIAAILLLHFYRKVATANQKLNSINKQLAHQSSRDPLTGVFNRRALQQHMQQREMKRRRADKISSSTCLLLLDIDHFKHINDRYGHTAGDAVLIAISNRLQATVREQDMVVRWGGEEILLVLENLSPEQHAGFVERVLKKIGDVPVPYEDNLINVTASGGFIQLPFAGIDEMQLGWEQLMQIIDLALYRSKAIGRNQVCVVNHLNVKYEDAKSLLFSDLGKAVDDGIVDISTIFGPAIIQAQ